jgi:tRNA(Ile)-lysidine synthase
LHEPKTEGAAREARYAFLIGAAKRKNLGAIVTAHTADDQAETVLMQLLRGAGTHGLAGMRPVTERDGVPVLRPWLGVRRAEVQAYAEAHLLEWREDAFNRDATHLRVRIRHKVLPVLAAEFRESVVPALVRVADLAGEDDAWLEQEAESALERVRDRSQPERLVVPELRRLPLALRRRAVRRWLRMAEVPNVGAEEVAGVLGLLEKTSPARVNVPGGRQVRRAAGRLTIVVVPGR